MEAQQRRLVVVRHAKSAWPAGVPDRRRPLGPRGQADAPVMGTWLRSAVGVVDVVVVSPAERTQQTWQLLAAELDEVSEQRTDDRIYDEWGGRMLEVVQELPDSAATALIVGHEPGVSELVLRLADRGNPTLRDRIDAKFPTCGVAVLSLDRPWSAVVPGCAVLEEFVVPRELRS